MKPHVNRTPTWIILILFTALGLFAFAASLLTSAHPGAASAPVGGPPDISIVPFADGLNLPVDIAHAGDSRLFVVEQTGVIRIVQADGTVLPTPFLDITARVEYGFGEGNEQGLLGLAFDPNYASNGYFYVNYTYCTIADCPDYGDTPFLYTRISRFSVTANENIANPNSEVVILTIQQPYGEHNGGDLSFGPDDYLYIGMGDGGSANDPENRSQNGMELLGKILRIDVDGGGLAPECDPAGLYTIPSDNPFVSTANTCNEIWQFGLRNPWRFSFDRATGDFYLGDVGQWTTEEVDYVPAGYSLGLNFGWSAFEGTNPYLTDVDPLGYVTMPIHQYPHVDGCSVTGGFVYRGAALPELQGYYFFGDYCSGRVWTLYRNSTNQWQHALFMETQRVVSSFGEDEAGELYLVDYKGDILKLVAAPS
ncbi:MAG: PQQ-dependent sugar dehydrogenase [Anaerolineales bacterium]|nr:PQQ-dependent sugar dehydrogenase [Anaerolineales bacterium]